MLEIVIAIGCTICLAKMEEERTYLCYIHLKEPHSGRPQWSAVILTQEHWHKLRKMVRTHVYFDCFFHAFDAQ